MLVSIMQSTSTILSLRPESSFVRATSCSHRQQHYRRRRRVILQRPPLQLPEESGQRRILPLPGATLLPRLQRLLQALFEATRWPPKKEGLHQESGAILLHFLHRPRHYPYHPSVPLALLYHRWLHSPPLRAKMDHRPRNHHRCLRLLPRFLVLAAASSWTMPAAAVVLPVAARLSMR